MSNKKQSSVEWFIYADNIIAEKYLNNEISYDDYKVLSENVIQQAKAMHKEEIDSAYTMGSCESDYDLYDPELYYKNTFNNEQKS